MKCQVYHYTFASVYQWLDSLLAKQKAEGSSPFTRSLTNERKNVIILLNLCYMLSGSRNFNYDFILLNNINIFYNAYDIR